MRRRILLPAAALLIGLGFAFGCAGLPPASGLDVRADQIALQIERAEQMGARECAPKELARAKVMLEHARHEMVEGHYPAAWTMRDLEAAERAASEMLQKRVIAQRYGFRCFHRGG